MPTPELLVESVVNRRLVPFVGAGVSRSVRKKDGTQAFPSWTELLRQGAAALRSQGEAKIAAYVEAGIDVLGNPNTWGPNPVQIGDQIRNNMPGNRWAKFLECQLNPSRQEIDLASLELPKEIWSLASNFLITTNFDKTLTWTCPQPGDEKILDLDNYAGLANTLSDTLTKPTIWHLHGYIDNPSKLILTSDTYEQLYGSDKADTHTYPAALQTLTSVLASKTMLFIGFSFTDEYVCKQLESLAKIFNGYNGEHFALVHKDEVNQARGLLDKLQVEPIQFDGFGAPLLEKVRSIVGDVRKARPSPAPPPAEDLKETLSPKAVDPMPPRDRWRATQAVRLLDQIGPTYILDRGYFFTDWNAAFERLFAAPLRLYRGQHAQEFVRRLANRGAVEARARQVFTPDNLPLVDMEPLVFQSEEFGAIQMWKIASRIVDDEGQLAGWSVALNITGAEKLEAIWDELKRVLDGRVNWALYSRSYDKLVQSFDGYSELIELVCSKVDGAVQCADIGAGTGNGTLALLRRQPDRTVWAIEPMEEMLSQLRYKIDAAGVSDRVQFIKQSVELLGEFEAGYFDGAIMNNVLYAVDDPVLALKEVARVMQPGSVLALSTSHSETDVDRLFRAISDNLRQKGKLAEFRSTLKETREQHERMIGKIRRDSKAQIQQYLEQAGFITEGPMEDHYAGAVVVVKAVKQG